MNKTAWRAQLDTPTNDARANLPVCPNLTASQRSNAGGTLGIRTREHRSARSGGSLGGVPMDRDPTLVVVSSCAQPALLDTATEYVPA
jgi:hypothetical protein